MALPPPFKPPPPPGPVPPELLAQRQQRLTAALAQSGGPVVPAVPPPPPAAAAQTPPAAKKLLLQRKIPPTPAASAPSPLPAPPCCSDDGGDLEEIPPPRTLRPAAHARVVDSSDSDDAADDHNTLPAAPVSCKPIQSFFRPAPAAAFKPPAAAASAEAVPAALVPAAAPRAPATGLTNLGNTCYVNSVLQALRHCRGLPGLFDAAACQVHVPTPLLRAVACLWTRQRHTEAAAPPLEPAVVRPAAVMAALGRANAMFAGSRQHDAQEFLRFLLAHMEECQTAAEVKGGGGGDDDDDEKTPSNDDHEDDVVVAEANRTDDVDEVVTLAPVATPVAGLVTGQLRYATTCLACASVTTRTEAFSDLSLPVPEGTAGLSLTACFNDLFTTSGDRLCGANKYSCERCATLTEATRTVRLAEVPPVLTVHLNRSTADGRGKIRRPVQLPFSLRLDSWATDDCPNRGALYRLAAIVYHSGHTAASGHYICAGRAANILPVDRVRPHDAWHLFDDGVVTATTERQLQQLLLPAPASTATAFLLFYTRE